LAEPPLLLEEPPVPLEPPLAEPPLLLPEEPPLLVPEEPPLLLPPAPPLPLVVDEDVHAMSAKAKLPTSRDRGARQ
jgi:hypothetical protein